MKLYKILVNGKSCHGGNLRWSLPRKDGGNWLPGAWHEVTGDVKLCVFGLHLAFRPYEFYKWGCECYLAEAAAIHATDEEKIVCRRARLLKPVPHPSWWIKAQEFVASISDIPWMKPDGKPLKDWKVFPTRAAAWDAAGDPEGDHAWDAARAAVRAAALMAARAAVRDAALVAAWDAAGDPEGDHAWDAILMAQTIVCSDLPIDPDHIQHARDRWRVWQKGYGLLCNIDRVLYVYERLE